MPRKFTITHDVAHARGAGPSGRALARELRERGYAGPMVNWGVPHPWMADMPGLVNSTRAVARASNKRVALQVMRAAGVPCPEERSIHESYDHPIVARSDRHRQGSGFWFIPSEAELALAQEQGWFTDHRANAVGEGATHAMEFIGSPSREFRVHVLFGQSHKLTEKVFQADHVNADVEASGRNWENGWVQVAPQPGQDRRPIREAAKAAVEALGLDFGAVDVITTSERVLVLEVNTAPRLVDPLSDTLGRYASAFLGRPT